MEYTKAIIFSAAIVIAAFLLGNAYRSKYEAKGTIEVTGLGEKSFISDQIVWEGSFERQNMDLKSAYADIEQDKKMVEEYLSRNGVKAEDIIFKAVNTTTKLIPRYHSNGTYAGDDFGGYNLSISVQITSQEVEKIEQLSRNITELLNSGIQFYSQPPRYYYTKLADLKIELISKATEDAKTRINTISQVTGAKTRKLVDAQMGIFQITGKNSDEEYSWGGTFNTSSKEKKASITMKLRYRAG